MTEPKFATAEDRVKLHASELTLPELVNWRIANGKRDDEWPEPHVVNQIISQRAEGVGWQVQEWMERQPEYTDDADDVFAEMATKIDSGRSVHEPVVDRGWGVMIEGNLLFIERPPGRFVRWMVAGLTGWLWHPCERRRWPTNIYAEPEIRLL